MKVIILGCGGSAGVPMLGGEDGRGIWGDCDPYEPRNIRTRASIFIQMDDGEGILVDTGPDVRAQLLAHGISAFKSIFYTHAHADHIAGLDEVRGINRVVQQPLKAYGTPTVLEEIQTRFSYVFKPWTPPHFFRAVVEAHPVPLAGDVVIGGYKLSLFEQSHGRIPSSGLRCGDFAYSTDVVELPERSLQVLSGVDTWVVDCFQKQPHSAHAWLERVLEWKEQIKPRRLILTHMGTDMDWAWMQDNLPEGVEAAWDGLTLTRPDPERG
ncbi:MBL fold metallo-hydrolase [Acetobacter farinalis]|uniref:MBL fold metallo-hydrolase n=1 Tax=Acetobacter farinalis TaxID=1260984 RepID=A0ABT3Q4X0_9PROT|nr:MBL fold metallo-hydrolase [Acetobacter farinalis]MCX2560332.1 MBL fold metallo-hydrolase [Acetobacter farinalis]NHO28987.1 MBL fold metallo-hydrolase [Acetobacter farinalis]